MLQTDKTIKSEAYCLEITPKKITVKAADAKGFFYALQSIRQLLPPAIESAGQSGWYGMDSAGNDHYR